MSLGTDALFFMLGWDRYGSTKKVLGHVMPDLWFHIRWEFLHSRDSVGHVVHSAAFGA
jgi:hypothetical protein